jgi:hypothetical protein
MANAVAITVDALSPPQRNPETGKMERVPVKLRVAKNVSSNVVKLENGIPVLLEKAALRGWQLVGDQATAALKARAAAAGFELVVRDGATPVAATPAPAPKPEPAPAPSAALDDEIDDERPTPPARSGFGRSRTVKDK